MSKANAQKFLDDVNTSAGLKKKVLGAATSAQAWVASALAAGYPMTVDDLRAATEALIGTKVSGDQLPGALRGLFEGELTDASLDAVAGGIGPIASAAPKKLLHITAQPVAGGVSPDEALGKPAPAPVAHGGSGGGGAL